MNPKLRFMNPKWPANSLNPFVDSSLYSSLVNRVLYSYFYPCIFFFLKNISLSCVILYVIVTFTLCLLMLYLLHQVHCPGLSVNCAIGSCWIMSNVPVVYQFRFLLARSLWYHVLRFKSNFSVSPWLCALLDPGLLYHVVSSPLFPFFLSLFFYRVESILLPGVVFIC